MEIQNADNLLRYLNEALSQPLWLSISTDIFGDVYPFIFACQLVGVDRKTAFRIVELLSNQTIKFPSKKTVDSFIVGFSYWKLMMEIQNVAGDQTWHAKEELRTKIVDRMLAQYDMNQYEFLTTCRNFFISRKIENTCICGVQYHIGKSHRSILYCPDCIIISKQRKK